MAVLQVPGLPQDLSVEKTLAPPPPILTREQIVEELHKKNRHLKTPTYRAFYSSIIGGITRDPAAMVLPMDDHMVHRGHAVFDTAIIHRGLIYELEEHLDRLLRSAAAAKIRGHLPREQLRDIILATASASGLEEGFIRYWLSVGPGGFSVAPAECPVPTFYCLVIAQDVKPDMSSGMRMITAKTPMKSPMMSTTKTVNYLPNALVHMEAEEAGVDEALWIDERGFIGEGPNMNVAFVSEDGYFLVPAFDRILAGCTIKKVMQLAEILVQSPAANGASNGSTNGASNGASNGATNGASNGLPYQSNGLIKGVRCQQIPEAEARRAREMMLIGSGCQVAPVIEWDGVPVGTGKPGPVAAALHQLTLEAYKSTSLTAIPKMY